MIGRSRRDIVRIAKHTNRYHSPFPKEREGREPRIIEKPNDMLKGVQATIKDRILKTVTLPDGMKGGVIGKSIRDNAGAHVGKPAILKMDIKNCFPSISRDRIVKVFRYVFGCPKQMAIILANLTTYDEHLAQGSPASTYLANPSLVPLYNELNEFSKAHGHTCTIFVDDITISGPNPRVLLTKAVRIIRNHGHAISCHKLTIQSSGKLQEVTGLGVNRRVGVTRKRVKAYRGEILTLAGSECILPSQINSVFSKISFVRGYDKGKATSLDALVSSKLPDTATILPTGGETVIQV